MGENGLSASDVALMSRDGDGFGNGWGGMIWLFAILAMCGGGFNWGGNGNNSNAIQNDINRGFDNQNLQAQSRDILAAITAGTAQAVATTNQVYHDITSFVGDKYNELQRDVAGLAVGQANILAHQNDCCCSITRQLMQNNYDAALRDAATNANFTAQIQGVKDMMVQDKMEAMQNRINQLELQNALQGVVRYPNGYVYTAGNSPFCSCNCGNM